MVNILQRGNCDVTMGEISKEATYRYQKGLVYPINMVRNVARISAATHFVFPSDIELYPRYTKIFNAELETGFFRSSMAEFDTYLHCKRTFSFNGG